MKQLKLILAGLMIISGGALADEVTCHDSDPFPGETGDYCYQRPLDDANELCSEMEGPLSGEPLSTGDCDEGAPPAQLSVSSVHAMGTVSANNGNHKGFANAINKSGTKSDRAFVALSHACAGQSIHSIAPTDAADCKANWADPSQNSAQSCDEQTTAADICDNLSYNF